MGCQLCGLDQVFQEIDFLIGGNSLSVWEFILFTMFFPDFFQLFISVSDPTLISTKHVPLFRVIRSFI